jgi:hypothetical protein
MLSRVGSNDDDLAAAASCKEAMQTSTPDANFIDVSECPDERNASAAECAAALESYKKDGGDVEAFCKRGGPIVEAGDGGVKGHPNYMCRDDDATCKGNGGTCWDPEVRAEQQFPFGCVLNKATKKVMYFSKADGERFYDGFDYEVICERYECPKDADGDTQRPLELTKQAVLDDPAAKPGCELSASAIEKNNEEDTKQNNNVFIPIATALTFVAMLGAYYYLSMGATSGPKLIEWDSDACLGFSFTAELKWILFGVGLRVFDLQTDWGFYAISLQGKGFAVTAAAHDDGTFNLKQLQHACLVFCILGLLMTPFDIWGNRQRTLNKVGLAMSISTMILFLEDVPQLAFNIKFMQISGVGDPIAILSLLASIGNIVYNVGLIISELCAGEKPALPEALASIGSSVDSQLARKDAEIRELKSEIKALKLENKAVKAQNKRRLGGAALTEEYAIFNA